MAAGDNTPQNGTDNVATDDITTLNGSAQTAGTGKAQRIKPGHGVDGVFRDTSAQFPFPVTTDRRAIAHKGRACTFRIPGRAGTTGQKLFAIHNATGSAVKVDVDKIAIDLTCTVVKAVTVLPPVLRLWKVTVLPTGGTSLTKVSEDSSLSASSSSVTVFGDASADGTLSGTALTSTLSGTGTGVLTQEFAPRLITAAGYEMFDRTTFLDGQDEVITLNPLEGLVLFADYTLATQNPATDMWTVVCRWQEYTLAP